MLLNESINIYIYIYIYFYIYYIYIYIDKKDIDNSMSKDKYKNGTLTLQSKAQKILLEPFFEQGGLIGPFTCADSKGRLWKYLLGIAA